MHAIKRSITASWKFACRTRRRDRTWVSTIRRDVDAWRCVRRDRSPLCETFLNPNLMAPDNGVPIFHVVNHFQVRRGYVFSRRDMLVVSAAGAVMTANAAHAASFGNPDEPAQGAVNGKGPGNLRDPGPQSEA